MSKFVPKNPNARTIEQEIADKVKADKEAHFAKRTLIHGLHSVKAKVGKEVEVHAKKHQMKA